MSPTPETPFKHLPELAGAIVAAGQSRLRITDQVLAEWDGQAIDRGLGPTWRLSDDALEASRQGLLGTSIGQQDLWIFAYGSLMWDPALHFSEVRRATLPGFERRFCCKTTIGRGTVEQPGLVLSLHPGPGPCHGLVFRIDASLAEQESRLFWRRELLFGGYRPVWQPVATPQGEVRALVLMANPGHPSHAGEVTQEAAAAVIRSAQGDLGTNLEYFQHLVGQLGRLGIVDPQMRRLSDLIAAA